MKISILFAILTMLIVTPLYSSETSTYEFNWLDPDKEVYVLQNRKFRKVGRAYVDLSAGRTTSGAFNSAFVAQGRAGYFFREDWGVEVLYSINSSDTNDTFESVLAQGSIPFVRLVQNYFGGQVMWSPFYAKINTFDKIVYFDWMLGLGAASLTEENNRVALNNNNSNGAKNYTSETHTGVMWSTALRFYLSETFSVRLNLTTVHYQAQKALANSTSDIWYDNYDLTLGLGLAL